MSAIQLKCLAEIVEVCEFHKVQVDDAIHLLQEYKKMEMPEESKTTVVKVRNVGTNNQKIEAIKLIRAYTGMGLKEAKDAVEQETTFEIETDQLESFKRQLTDCGYQGYVKSKKKKSTIKDFVDALEELDND